MADKKLFEDLVLTSTPLTTDRVALGKAGSAYKNITAADLRTWMLASVPPLPTLLTKVVNITNFDMSGSGEKTKTVALGVVRDKIRSCTVLIKSNQGGLYPLSLPAGNKEIKSYWYIRQDAGDANNAVVYIYTDCRTNPAFFDQSSFDGNGTGGIRGYIYVTYVP